MSERLEVRAQENKEEEGAATIRRAGFERQSPSLKFPIRGTQVQQKDPGPSGADQMLDLGSFLRTHSIGRSQK